MCLAAKSKNIPVFFMENGLIPNTTTLDFKGVNYENSVPRNPDFFLKNYYQPPTKTLLANTKEKYIFVPFQVNTDTQIINFSPWIKDMYMLVRIIEKACLYLPKGYKVIFKTHPVETEQSLQKIFTKIEGIKTNDTLISSFLHYMTNEYQIPQNWRENPNQMHFNKIKDKLFSHLNSQKI